jgi:uncharacterized protein with FMN-binding domain
MKSFVLSMFTLPAVLAGTPVFAQAQVQPVAATGYADGTYTGPSANAYYGNVQLAVIIQGGRITGFRLLDYPSHTGTSQRINQQALPMLAQEVLTAQSGQVDFISGATLSSEAFVQSVGGALSQARL